MADTIVDAPPGYTKGGVKIGSIVDAPPGYNPGGTAAPKPGKSLLQKAGDFAGGLYRNEEAARTAAARDPVGALGNILGAAEGAVVGGVQAPLRLQGADRNDLGKVLSATGHGIVSGATNPQERDRYNQEFGDMILGPAPQKPTMPQRIARGVENFGLQTMIDPVTHGGGTAMKGIFGAAKPVMGAVAKGVKPVGDYVGAVRDALHDPALAPAVGKVAHAIGKLTAPIRGGVDASKDLLFLNPLPHGLGNMTTLNFLANGPGTTAKGLWYGLRGAPKGSVQALKDMGAGAYTPELLDEPSPWGPVGWASALGKKGVPAAVRGGVGAAAGGTIGNRTAPDNATPEQRRSRTIEGTILGALTGASPEALNVSNKLMTRLETGHRAAMLESLPAVEQAGPTVAKAAAKAATKATGKAPSAEQTLIKLVQNGEIPIESQEAIFKYLKAHPNISAAQKDKYLTAVLRQIGKMPEAAAPVEEPIAQLDPRAAAINRAFGGGPKSPAAKVFSSLGGPFTDWQFDVMPRTVGGSLVKAPARVEAFARGQDITNRDVLPHQPYKLQVGGPVGGAAEAIFNTPKYASRLIGPLGSVDPSQTTNPKTFSLPDKLKEFSYGATPGREVVGPFFGDTMFPSKAPAIPNAAVGGALGWHFSNKTPAIEAVLEIMRTTGLDQNSAWKIYERSKK